MGSWFRAMIRNPLSCHIMVRWNAHLHTWWNNGNGNRILSKVDLSETWRQNEMVKLCVCSCGWWSMVKRRSTTRLRMWIIYQLNPPESSCNSQTSSRAVLRFFFCSDCLQGADHLVRFYSSRLLHCLDVWYLINKMDMNTCASIH